MSKQKDKEYNSNSRTFRFRVKKDSQMNQFLSGQDNISKAIRLAISRMMEQEGMVKVDLSGSEEFNQSAKSKKRAKEKQQHVGEPIATVETVKKAEPKRELPKSKPKEEIKKEEPKAENDKKNDMPAQLSGADFFNDYR